MAYIDPKTVNSPKASWKLFDVLRNGEVDGNGDNDASIALGEWDGERCLALRWNGSSEEDRGVGSPQSRGLATWFIVPWWMNEAILNSDLIPEEKRGLVTALLK